MINGFNQPVLQQRETCSRSHSLLSGHGQLPTVACAVMMHRRSICEAQHRTGILLLQLCDCLYNTIMSLVAFGRIGDLYFG